MLSPLPKDNIEAYKTQNTYLNAEIYKLTKVWRQSTEQEKCLMIKVPAAAWHLQDLTLMLHCRLCSIILWLLLRHFAFTGISSMIH